MASVRKIKWASNGSEKSAWQVTYTDPITGKRPSKSFKMKKEADAFRLKVEREIEDGSHVARAGTLTVGELCGIYIDHNKDRVADGRITRASFTTIRNHVTAIADQLGRIVLTDLKPRHVEEFYRATCAVGRLSPITAKVRVRWVRILEEFATRRGYTRGKSAAEVALRDLRGVERKPIRTFTLEEAKAIVEALKTKRWRGEARAHAFLNCLVHVAMFCGLRAGEVVGLRRDSIDFGAGVLRIRHSLSLRDGLKGPKTKAGNRNVPMPSHVAEMLGAWLAQYALPNADDLFFTTDTGSPYRWPSVHFHMWKPLLKRAGLPEEMHFHALRHFAASFMVSNNMPITDVASLLGHSKFDMTLQVYAHPILGATRQQAAIERMSRTLIATPAALDAKRERKTALTT